MSLLHNISNRLALQEMNVQLKLPLLARRKKAPESAKISKSVALDDTKFVIEGLLSNTAYHVVVLASGPLGNVNGTSILYTAPKEVQGDST